MTKPWDATRELLASAAAARADLLLLVPFTYVRLRGPSLFAAWIIFYSNEEFSTFDPGKGTNFRRCQEAKRIISSVSFPLSRLYISSHLYLFVINSFPFQWFLFACPIMCAVVMWWMKQLPSARMHTEEHTHTHAQALTQWWGVDFFRWWQGPSAGMWVHVKKNTYRHSSGNTRTHRKKSCNKTW